MTMFWPAKQQPVSGMIADRVANAEMMRAQAINTRWQRYDGQYNKPLKPTDMDPDGRDNTTVNYARKTVDISAFYLFGKGIGFDVDTARDAVEGADSTAETPEDDWLEACWNAQADGKEAMLLEFATSAGVSGDGFLRIFLPDKAMGEEYPRIVALDSSNVTAICDPADYNRVQQYKIQWTGMDPTTNKPVVYRHLITREGVRWTIEEQQSAGDNPNFVTTSGPNLWPYKWCPIWHCKNRPMPHSFYGTSDVEDDVLHINDAINFVLSSINRILRAHAHPFQYVKGQALDLVDRAVGQMPYFPSPEAEVKSVEMISDLASSFSQLKELNQVYHELTSIPEVATGKLENVGQLSGLALQILYGPLVALTTVKRTLYGTMLKRLCMALLEIGGFSGVKGVSLQWSTLIPTDRQAEAATALTLQQAGVSKDTTIQELGYDSQSEIEKSQSEAESAVDLAMRKFESGGGTGGNGNGSGDN